MNVSKSSISEPPAKKSDYVFVGRQPIYNADLTTYAYELLFRSSEDNRADFSDGERATARLLLNTFAEIGLERIVGTLPAFFNASEEFILKRHCLALPKERVVLEVLEDVRPTPEVLLALSELRDEGYILALDDYVHSPDMVELVKLAHIIKVDLPAIPSAELPKHVEQLRNHDVRLLAEKVETSEEFELCKRLGFDYFQGYFFCRPTVITGRQVPANRVTMMRLIAKIQQPDVSLDQVSEIIQSEPSLAFRLLRFVNSANSSLSGKVESIRHAVTLAGANRIKTMACLSALAEAGDEKPGELIRTVLTRAKMAELLAVALQNPSTESYFLTGLFSGLDVLLDLPMEQALAMVPVSEEIAEALTSFTGELGEILNCVMEYERGNWNQIACGSLGNAAICDAYLQAVDWVSEALADM